MRRYRNWPIIGYNRRIRGFLNRSDGADFQTKGKTPLSINYLNKRYDEKN